MESPPLISVLMTAYNREQYIGEAIESVLGSVYTNWELIISDDHSTDNTYPIAQSYAEKDSRIKLYKNENNLGDYPNRNKAASYAKGEYLMSVDSDDLLLSDTISKCVALFDLHPSANFGLFCPQSLVTDILPPEETIKKHFFAYPFLLVGPGGTIIKNSFFKKIGGFPIKYGPSNDGYYNLKAASQTNIILMPFEFIFYRRHEGQEINNKYAYLSNSYLYLRDALNELHLPLSKSEKEFLENKNKRRFLMNILKFYLKSKDWNRTKEALKSTQFTIKDTLVAFFH
jgi:glycosyltransferase involved in cell wall biosynthesis